jgi:hypothetical protein
VKPCSRIYFFANKLCTNLKATRENKIDLAIQELRNKRIWKQREEMNRRQKKRRGLQSPLAEVV